MIDHQKLTLIFIYMTEDHGMATHTAGNWSHKDKETDPSDGERELNFLHIIASLLIDSFINTIKDERTPLSFMPKIIIYMHRLEKNKPNIKTT